MIRSRSGACVCGRAGAGCHLRACARAGRAVWCLLARPKCSGQACTHLQALARSLIRPRRWQPTSSLTARWTAASSSAPRLVQSLPLQIARSAHASARSIGLMQGPRKSVLGCDHIGPKCNLVGAAAPFSLAGSTRKETSRSFARSSNHNAE